MARDAFEMSVSPSQNLAKPSPVPGPSTDIATAGLSALNAAATLDEMGSTVDDPETSIDDDPEPPPAADASVELLPHAVATIASAMSIAIDFPCRTVYSSMCFSHTVRCSVDRTAAVGLTPDERFSRRQASTVTRSAKCCGIWS